MSQAQDEISELMALQREVASARPRPRKTDSKAEAAGETESDEASGSAPADDKTDRMSDLEESMQELSDNLESAVQEIEEAAKEHPALVALVAFTLGLVVGQLFSRR